MVDEGKRKIYSRSFNSIICALLRFSSLFFFVGNNNRSINSLSLCRSIVRKKQLNERNAIKNRVFIPRDTSLLTIIITCDIDCLSIYGKRADLGEDFRTFQL